jgi:hypothetical protein
MTITAETMFDRRGEVRPVARATDPDTSHRAAALASLKAGSNRLLALDALRAAGENGLTDFELESATSIPQTSIGKRRHDLWRLGLVEKTSMRRPAPSGAMAIVWRAVGG